MDEATNLLLKFKYSMDIDTYLLATTTKKMQVSKVRGLTQLIKNLLVPRLLDKNLLSVKILDDQDLQNYYGERNQVFWSQKHPISSVQPSTTYDLAISCLDSKLCLMAQQIAGEKPKSKEEQVESKRFLRRSVLTSVKDFKQAFQTKEFKAYKIETGRDAYDSHWV